MSTSSLDTRLALAATYHRDGRTAEAEVICREVLVDDPACAEGHYLLSLLAAEAGDFTRSVVHAEAALLGAPGDARYHAARGDALLRLGRRDEASATLEHALTLDPGSPEAHGALGTLRVLTGRLDEGITLYREALRLDPSSAKVHANLGTALARKGDFVGAITSFETALGLRPSLHRAHVNLGNALREAGRLDEAVSSYERALVLDPTHLPALNNLGNALEQRGELDRAIDCFQRALELDPRHFEAWVNLGTVLRRRCRFDEAVAALRFALALQPGSGEANANLGAALLARGDAEGAIEACRRALLSSPMHASALGNLALALQHLGRIDEALEAGRRAVEAGPTSPELRNNLGGVLRDAGEVDEAIATFREALRLRPAFTEAHSNLLLMLHYRDVLPAAIFAEHLAWAGLHACALAWATPTFEQDRDPERRLRIGYLSPDFRTHSVAFFLEPALAARDRARFEVVCYDASATHDAVTTRLRGHADRWREVAALSDEELAALVRRDRIDVLVDLAGHTAKGRPLALARRPAPVQVTYLGYPDTTGLAAVGYRITDAVADPPGETERLHTEHLVRLPGGAWCYRPPTQAPAVAPLPATRTGHVTFGSFNASPKIAPPVLRAWARVLERVPGATLLVKARGLGEGTLGQSTAGRFEAAGIARARVRFVPWQASLEGHLALYADVDIALDTFPYGGTTTTCEALWMGVPVITLAGATHVARVGTSLLGRAGLESLVAQTPDQYVEIAARLSGRLDELGALRRGLRERMRGSPLTDADRFARELEAAYRAMWRAYCEGSAPALLRG